MNFRKTTIFRAAMSATAVLSACVCMATVLHAQNASCHNNLTMYGWGLAAGTFSTASTPNNMNLWVAEISSGNPEIHVTFNRTTPLHLTVRAGTTCEGYVNIGGTFPGNMTLINPPGSGTICNVTLTTYLARLNAINATPPLPHPLPVNACIAGFNKQTKLSQAAKGAYLQRCGDPTCP